MTIALNPPDYSPLTGTTIPLDTTILQKCFPQGVSTHGQRYLINRSTHAGFGRHPSHNTVPPSHLTYTQDVVELVFELVRRIEFPKCLSRFESVFACDNVPDLRAFTARTGTSGNVYELAFGRYERHDMAFLSMGDANIGAWTNARRYWNGDPSPTPQWEYLVELPVTLKALTATI